MGATLTGFWQCRPGGPLAVFHVGDSRLYRCRGGDVAVLTRDQTLYQQALEAGVGEDLPPRNLLLQAIGPTAAVAPDVALCAARPGDLYLLCSDGLYGNTPHAAIAQALAGAGAGSLDACCAELIALAKTHGSRDNITAVLALVEQLADAKN
jgi:protein phosphatase